MITIYAEKPDMGTKIAAALDCIHLDNGSTVNFDNIQKMEKAIKFQRTRDGYFKINYMGQPAVVTWGYGHMCGLKQAYDYNPEYKKWTTIPLPYVPDFYELKLTGPKEQYEKIKKLFNKSDCIICATDNDREGDLIFDYIYTYMNCRVPFKRALYNKQSQEEFIKAFRNENLISSADRMSTIHAGRARSNGDFIVGTGPTVAMSLKYPGNGITSVGRVQTAVLNMIVKKEVSILNFKPTDYWVIKGRFTTDNNEVYIGTHKSKKITNKKEAETLMNNLKTSSRNGAVTKVTKKTYKKTRPFLYSLASLQMEANKAFGYSLDQTLQIAQSLYDKGVATYPRTDSMHLPEDMVEEMNKTVKTLLSLPWFIGYENDIVRNSVEGNNEHYFDTSKVASHYAIVPTPKVPENLTADEENIYKMISISVLCMLFDDATMSSTQIETTVNNEVFVTSGTSVIEQNFLKLTGLPKENVIPAVNEGDNVTAQYGFEAKQTEAPKRYTDATLLKAMIYCNKTIEDEELKKLMAKGPGGKPRGLGRPSSQASIVTTLEKRKYIEKKGKTIYPTKKGMEMVACFPIEELKSAEMTALWEKRLDDIEEGKDSYESFMKDLENSVRLWTQQIIDAPVSPYLSSSGNCDYVCPVCGGAIRKFDWGYACASNCGFKVGYVIAEKKISEKDIKDIFTVGHTKMIRGFTRQDKTKFTASLCVDRENRRLAFNSGITEDSSLLCPICGSPMRKVEWGFSCSGYRTNGCRFSLGKIASKRLTDKQITDLLKGKTILVKGMTSTKGKKFDAKICLLMSGPQKGNIKFVSYES